MLHSNMAKVRILPLTRL